MSRNILVGYDPTNNESRYPAVDGDACKVMEQRQGWTLKRIVENKHKILTVICVFQGNVSFLKGFEEK